MQRPLIDTARIKIQGLSSELFERREIGDEMTLTVKGTIVSDLESVQAHEGTRRVQTLKLDRVVEGVSEKVHENADGQMTIGDVPDDHAPEDESSEPVDEGGLGEFTGGPTFSAGGDDAA